MTVRACHLHLPPSQLLKLFLELMLLQASSFSPNSSNSLTHVQGTRQRRLRGKAWEVRRKTRSAQCWQVREEVSRKKRWPSVSNAAGHSGKGRADSTEPWVQQRGCHLWPWEHQFWWTCQAKAQLGRVQEGGGKELKIEGTVRSFEKSYGMFKFFCPKFFSVKGEDS